MTTRIQKGGAIFRPATKARSRTVSSSTDTPSKGSEFRISEATRPSLRASSLQATAPVPAQSEAATLFSHSELSSTPTHTNTVLTNRPTFPSLRAHKPIASALASTNPRPPTLGRAIPLPSSFNRTQPTTPPFLNAVPTTESYSASYNNVNGLSSSGSSAEVSLSQDIFGFGDAGMSSHDVFSLSQNTVTGADPFSFDPMGDQLTQGTFLIAPHLSTDGMNLNPSQFHAIDPQLQPFLNGQLDFHSSANENGPPVALSADTVAKPKKRGQPNKVHPVEGEIGDGLEPSSKAPKSTKKSRQSGKKTLAAYEESQSRRQSQALEGDVSSDEDATPTAKKRRRTSRSQTPRPRKKRTPSLPPYNPEADPGDEIDPSVVTMASLCEDPGFGRVSSKAVEIQTNHATWKARNKEKRAMLRALMERKKYGLNESDGEDQPQQPPPSTKEPSPEAFVEGEVEPLVASGSGANSAQDETGNGFDYSENLTTSRFNVQVRIGPNGETIIDETSLTVDRDENDATENYTHVVESDISKFTNSGTYGKRFRGSRWSAEETELFYDALAQYGENYELIAFVLPGRDRKSCKNKFKAEDKKNPARITHALNNSKPVDMDTLSRMTGKDFSGPLPEIIAPSVLHVPPPEESTREPTPAPQAPVRKRSQSRKLTSTDGVQILGGIDDFVDKDIDMPL